MCFQAATTRRGRRRRSPSCWRLLRRQRGICEGGVHRSWRSRRGEVLLGSWFLRCRSLLLGVSTKHGGDVDGAMQKDSCWDLGWKVGGLGLLPCCLLVLYSSSWSEKYGVRPRPKLLYCFLLMRLVSKHPCDGTSTDLGVLAMAPLLRCWPGQQWRTTEAAAESGCGEHKRSLRPHCNFFLCKLVCTPVLSVCF